MADATIIVKLRRQPREPAARLERIVRLLGDDLVRTARPLFPGEQERDLASIYEVVLTNRDCLEETLSALNRAPEVEYAHTPQDRSERPARPRSDTPS